MTALVRPIPTESAAQRPPERSSAGRWPRILPGLLVLCALATALLTTGTPPGQVAAYGAHWGLALLLPGVLVHRALRGSRGNLPEDLGFGAVTGLVLELASWAVAAATGSQDVLWLWPVPVLVAFLVVPKLRRHWRIAAPEPLPLAWLWWTAAVMVGLIAWVAVQWAQVPLPPVTYGYQVDTYYLLSLVHELTRSMPFEVPQVAGISLRYHYLSYAHLATGSMVSGADPAVVLLRLWSGPVLLASVLVLAGVARQIIGRWWAGPLVAGVALLGQPLALGGPVSAPGALPISLPSPSLTYALPVMLVAISVICDVIRGGRVRAGWAVLAGAAVVCAGAKSSVLPIVAVGLVAATIARSVQTRRPAWAALSALALVGAAMAVGARLFVGGGAGGLHIQLLSIERFIPAFSQTVGAGQPVAVGGLLPPGLAGGGVADWGLALGLLGWWVVVQLPRLAGLLALTRPRIRSDPVAWFLAGALVAGGGAMWTLFHPAAGQGYFFAPAIPLGVILLVWIMADGATAAVRPAAVGLVAGLAGALMVHAAFTPSRRPTTQLGWVVGFAGPIVVGLAAAAVVWAGWWAWARRSPAVRSGVGAALAVGALLGGSLAAGWTAFEPVARRVLTGEVAASAYPVTRAEMRAALWLDRNAGRDDVVATNVHCRPLLTRPHCDARAFWVTGLGGRRTVMESWAYTEEAMAAHGEDGYGFAQQAPPDPARYALNERAFTDPTAEVLTHLRDQFGVRWLLADTRAGPVSPRLADLAVVRYRAGTVTVYEIPEV